MTTLEGDSMESDPRDVSPSHSPAGGNPMASLLDEYLPTNELRRGQTVNGVIVRTDPEVIVIDVGAKSEGTVSGRELELMDPHLRSSLQPGDDVVAYVVKPDGPRGEIVLSLVRARQEKDWRRAEELLEGEETVGLEVVGSNRGGVLVSLGSVRGFVPASQLDPSRRIPRISEPDCSQVLDQLVGSQLQVRVVEVNRERNRLILSERAALAKKRDEERRKALETLRAGDVREGTVSHLTDFGAFVSLGGIDGLLHLSEISWRPVEHPKDVLQLGQQIRVTVLKVDRERQQVALSTKRLEPDPWKTVGERYEVGQLVSGRITRLTKWGAFTRVVGDEAIEGLIHVSELDEQRVAHPSEVVRPGEVHTLRVVRVEPERHRLALSLKQVLEGEEPDVDWKADYEASAEPPLESPMASALEEALKG